MSENLKYFRFTVKDGSGISITIITDELNEKKVLESAKGNYDITEIEPDPELLKNAKVINAANPIPYKRIPSFQVPEILEDYTPFVKDNQSRLQRDRHQQNKYAARQNRKK